MPLYFKAHYLKSITSLSLNVALDFLVTCAEVPLSPTMVDAEFKLNGDSTSLTSITLGSARRSERNF